MANLANVDISADLTVSSSLEVAGVFSATSERIALDADEVVLGETAVFNVGEQIVDFG